MTNQPGFDSPFFEDHSSAGYDWSCHELTRIAADAWSLDARDPAHRLTIIQRWRMWTDKLDRATRLELAENPAPRTEDTQPF